MFALERANKKLTEMRAFVEALPPGHAKKMRATVVDGGTRRTVLFGQQGASDYTLHKDPHRMAAYLLRHGGDAHQLRLGTRVLRELRQSIVHGGGGHLQLLAGHEDVRAHGIARELAGLRAGAKTRSPPICVRPGRSGGEW